jgi:magnesium-transporting ATPase (P-type)
MRSAPAGRDSRLAPLTVMPATLQKETSRLPQLDRAWHTLPADEAVSILAGDGRLGLDEDEARRRLEHYGPNRLDAGEATPWWRILLHQFLDPLIYILLIAAAVTFFFDEYIDTAVILAVVGLNAAIGFVQEFRAQKAMQALARMSAPRAEVLRGGEPREIDSEELVPGDVVVLRSGDRIPADLRLLSVRDLAVDESALTGESLPVGKITDPLSEENLVPGDRKNLLFSGTAVTRGRGRGLVVRTGVHSELGQIADAVKQVVHTRMPIQEKVDRLAHGIGLAIAALSVLILGLGLAQGMTLPEIISTAVALAVAAIPEALPVVLTVTLAVGVQRMAKRNAIIRSLPAVETLGSTTVIASDKTGTLTRNEMTVRALWAGGHRYAPTGTGYDPQGEFEHDGRRVEVAEHPALRQTLRTGLLASEANRFPGMRRSADGGEADGAGGDPTEFALLVAAEKGGLGLRETRADYPERDMIPFESELQYMATLNDTPGGGRCVHLKGAPEAVLERCDRRLTEDGGEVLLDPGEILQAARLLAEEGYRVLAMAYRPTRQQSLSTENLGSGFVFAGLQAMEDPLRDEAIAAVRDAHRAGIRVLMITGDHATTAAAIGRQLGLQGSGAVEGREVEEHSDEELDRILRGRDIYARVSPHHKLRIVERLRAQGEIVAVTGDGVNDAPALRAAHLGVAMGKKGTDVAREASDMVLSDDNFASITQAVEAGRVVFANIRKVTYFLLSGSSVGVVLTIIVAMLLGWPLPFLAVQVLWFNLVTNGLQDVALAFEPKEPGLLNEPPRPPGEGVITRGILLRMVIVGTFIAAATLAVFWWTWQQTDDLDNVRSVAMTLIVFFQFFHVFNCRSMHRSIFRIPLFSNRFLFVSVVLAMAAQVAVLHLPFFQFVFQTTPLSFEQWVLVILVGLSVVVVEEINKAILRQRRVRAAR